MKKMNNLTHFSYSKFIWTQFKKNKLAYYSLYLIFFLIILAVLAPIISNDKPIIMKYKNKLYFPVFKEYPEFVGVNFKNFTKNNKEIWAVFPPIKYSPTEYDLASILIPPCKKHLLGTDDSGRDILARIIYGTRISLSVGFIATGISLLIGILIGALAGYYGGKIDIILSRFIEIIICFPTLILILGVLAIMKQSIFTIMIIIGIFGWTGIARLVRAEFLKLKNQEFVIAAKALGLSDIRIIFNHILPNALTPVLVSATFEVAGAILLESTLSFLGLGVPPPTPSWGSILMQAHDYVDFAWWLIIFPGLSIFLTVTAYNLVGEALRDAIDPRLRT